MWDAVNGVTAITSTAIGLLALCFSIYATILAMRISARVHADTYLEQERDKYTALSAEVKEFLAILEERAAVLLTIPKFTTSRSQQAVEAEIKANQLLALAESKLYPLSMSAEESPASCRAETEALQAAWFWAIAASDALGAATERTSNQFTGNSSAIADQMHQYMSRHLETFMAPAAESSAVAQQISDAREQFDSQLPQLAPHYDKLSSSERAAHLGTLVVHSAETELNQKTLVLVKAWREFVRNEGLKIRV